MRPDPGKQLRRLLGSGPVAVPGVYDALVARMAQQAGFEALYFSGAAFSASQLGLPDVGLFTLTELADAVRRITAAVEVPLIVDADTGFGGPLNVARAVKELQRAGAAAVQLEDQQLPKRCGHLSGKTLVECRHMCAKLQAAQEARADSSLILVARTDARAVEGLQAAVDRALAYLEAGADWIFPEALQTEEEFAQFAQQVQAPLVANMTEFGRSPLLSLQRLGELGYQVVLFPVTLLRVAAKSVQTALKTLREQGTQRSLLPQMQTRAELYQVLNYEDYQSQDRRFFTLENESSQP